MKAALNNYRQSPRKVRLVGDLIKGQSVEKALAQLQFLPKRASEPIAKLLRSAIANADGVTGLMVGNVRVDSGSTLKRMRPRARGSAARINKRTSRVLLTLKKLEVKN